MSMKQELETWVSALAHYDSSRYEEAIAAFQPIADTSKILFNCGVIRASIGDHAAAVQYYQRAVSLDQYLAIAYFQQGVSNFLVGDFEEALSNFNDALLYLRGNKCIDYEQLGLKFKLYSCEALFNRGLCYIYLQQTDAGIRDLTYAAKEKASPNHDVIDEAIKDKAEGYTVFSIPVGVVFRPSEAKVRNVGLRDYLGRARLVAAAEGPEITTQRRNFALEQWGRDDRAPDSISFAATHLVRPGTSNRTRQQSEPPMHRSMFPPTPPPEAEKPTFARPQRQPSPDYTTDAGRSRSLNRRPSRLELGLAALDSSQARRELPILRVNTEPIRMPTPEPALQLPRPRLLRSASERPAERIPERSIPSFESVRAPDSGLSFSPIERAGSKWSSKALSPESTQRGFWKSHTPSKQLKLQRPASIEEVDESNNGAYTAGTTDVSPASTTPSADPTNGLAWYFSRRLSVASSTNLSQNSGPAIRIKAHFGNDIRYLTIQQSATFQDFQTHVGKKFGLKRAVRVQTKDDEGDMITMADQEDMDTAIAMSVDCSGKDARSAGKIEVWVSET